jgi:uncharacterized protein
VVDGVSLVTAHSNIDSAISAGFNLMAKPIGPRCNLRCEYCFYLPKYELYPSDEKWRMSDEVLESYTRQYIDCQKHTPEVVFSWQGGEPTLMGLDFYRRAVELQQQYSSSGQKISNAFQTNGMLVDDDWCRFFHDEAFLVGLSLDGPADVHDPVRRDPSGAGTCERVVETLRRMQKHGVEVNVLCSVHRVNGRRPRQVYRFLRELGVQFIQFIPVVVPVPDRAGVMNKHSVTPAQWGSFMCEVFDEWVRNDVGTVFVQSFDMALAAWTGRAPPLCVHSITCGRALIVEHNGDIYSCDHFVTADHKLGNLLETPIKELVDQSRQQQFARDKRDRRPPSCKACRYDFICRGGCTKDRFVAPAGQKLPLNYLCKGFLRFYKHVDPYMRQMADALQRGELAAVVMKQFQREK